MEKKMNDILELKNRLISFAQAHCEDSGIGDIPLYGQIVDMIKDCYEMEEKCYKACYYKMMVEETKKEKEGQKMQGPYGYDNWRYPSSGRFASKGHGVRMGYMPMDEMDKMPWYDPMMGMGYLEGMDGPYGYGNGNSGGSRGDSGSYGGGRESNSGGSSGGNSGSRGGNSSGSSSGSSGRGQGGSSSGSSDYRGGRYGYPMDEMMNPYERFMESRRHYHESKNPEDKKEMEHHAKEHVEEVENSLRDIWEDATPELRKEMKRNLTNLINGLPA